MIFSLLTTIALVITIAGLVALVRALLAFFRLFGANVSEIRGAADRPSNDEGSTQRDPSIDRLSALKSMAFFAVAVGLAAGILLLRDELFPFR